MEGTFSDFPLWSSDDTLMVNKDDTVGVVIPWGVITQGRPQDPQVQQYKFLVSV